MEKHEKYVIQVRESEKRLEGDDLDEEEAFLERLDAGLYTLFRIDTTLGILICLRSEVFNLTHDFLSPTVYATMNIRTKTISR